MRMRDDRDHKTMLRAGQAWSEIKRFQKNMFTKWTRDIGPALEAARTEAMTISNSNQPRGRGYAEAMSALLKEYKLDDINETARAHALKVMENLEDVQE
jgi:hypothetical protein